MVVNWVAEVFAFPAVSSATFAATSTVTAPSLTGVIVAVYTALLLDDSALAVALATVISFRAKPVTSSLKVKVAVNALLVMAPVISDVMTMLGALAS